jgi:succinylarginine dihydrolase
LNAIEANYDGLIGPTHNYAGLSRGNVASQEHGGIVAHPRQAALQGLAKMKRVHDLGLVQGVLPPQERPAVWRLRELGFCGADARVIEQAWAQAPELVARVSSASSMWAANAATVCPAADTADGLVHLTPANLATMPHRSLEADATGAALRVALPDETHFTIHPPLPAHADFADEGAANHLRLCQRHGDPGAEVFVYGRSAGEPSGEHDFPARQTLRAGQAIAASAGLDPGRTAHLRQASAAIAAGAFHNDVVAVSHETTLLFHEAAFADRNAAIATIRRAAAGLLEPRFVEVSESEVPLADAVSSYLFNSQLLRPPGHRRQLLLAPLEVAETASSRSYCEALVASDGPIGAVEYTDLRQSMQNGGGPACLRLRVVLTEQQLAAVNRAQLFSDALYAQLVTWVERHYREDLAPEALGDPSLLLESRAALDELTQILQLGSAFYPFQRG